MSASLPEGKNAVVHGLGLPVELEAVAGADVVSGKPRQGVTEFGEVAGAEVGVWELRDGVVTDTEVDELFIVLSGGATIEFLDEPGADGAPRSITVRAGDIARLVGGSRTRWSVDGHVRKVYIAEA